MARLDDDAHGQPLVALWEREVDALPAISASWKGVTSRGFDDPEWFSAFLHTVRWNCITSTDVALFHAPYRAGIEVRAFQLEPLRKALLMPRVNLFIADNVGLGKTIEAGLILRELLVRQKVRRVVMATRPSVVRQGRPPAPHQSPLAIPLSHTSRLDVTPAASRARATDATRLSRSVIDPPRLS